MTKKRNSFGELMEGVAAMESHRDGKITLRSRKIEPQGSKKTRAQGRGRLGLRGPR
jgi:hypothetical protein